MRPRAASFRCRFTSTTVNPDLELSSQDPHVRLLHLSGFQTELLLIRGHVSGQTETRRQSFRARSSLPAAACPRLKACLFLFIPCFFFLIRAWFAVFWKRQMSFSHLHCDPDLRPLPGGAARRCPNRVAWTSNAVCELSPWVELKIHKRADLLMMQPLHFWRFTKTYSSERPFGKCINSGIFFSTFQTSRVWNKVNLLKHISHGHRCAWQGFTDVTERARWSVRNTSLTHTYRGYIHHNMY